MFGSVIRFMCGHRLQGLMNSTCGNRLRRLSAIEHSVTIATRRGRSFASHCPMALVEPTKSASASTSGEHSGWATIFASKRSRVCRASIAVNFSCTSQVPCHSTSSTSVCFATQLPRYRSGRKITLAAPVSAAMASTTCTALAEVQQASDSAFTAAEVLT